MADVLYMECISRFLLSFMVLLPMATCKFYGNVCSVKQNRPVLGCVQMFGKNEGNMVWHLS